MATSAPLVRTCNPTDPSEGGHALVIVHYLDKKTNTRTFFMGEESSYKERTYKNTSGKNVKERMRRFPPTVATNADRKTYVRTNKDLKANSHFVLREDKTKGNYKYTIQEPNGIWGFPKGSGSEANSKDIVKREFEEETGYVLDTTRLVFKKCVEVKRYDNKKKRDVTQQTVVFHYELSDEKEKNALLTAFARKDASKEGELFHGGFFEEAEVNHKKKNAPSQLAFSDFGLDHSTVVDQSTIPRGGEVVSAAVPALPPVPPAPSAPTPVRVARGPNASGVGFHSRTVAAAPAVAWRRSGKVYAAPTSAPPSGPGPRRKFGGSRKSRKTMTRKRR